MIKKLIKELLYRYGGKIDSDKLPHCEYNFVGKGEFLQEGDLVYTIAINAWTDALPDGENPINQFVVPVIRAVRYSYIKIAQQMDKEHEEAVRLGNENLKWR